MNLVLIFHATIVKSCINFCNHFCRHQIMSAYLSQPQRTLSTSSSWTGKMNQTCSRETHSTQYQMRICFRFVSLLAKISSPQIRTLGFCSTGSPSYSPDLLSCCILPLLTLWNRLQAATAVAFCIFVSTAPAVQSGFAGLFTCLCKSRGLPQSILLLRCCCRFRIQ